MYNFYYLVFDCIFFYQYIQHFIVYFISSFECIFFKQLIRIIKHIDYTVYHPVNSKVKENVWGTLQVMWNLFH